MADGVSLYLKIDSIKGGGTEKDHKEWIPIRAFAPVSKPPRLRDGKEIHDDIRSTAARISFAAPSDVSFSQLMRSASAGDRFDSATLDQVKDHDMDATLVTLANVVVVACQAKGDGFYFTLDAASSEYRPSYLPRKNPDPSFPDLLLFPAGYQ